MTNTTVPTWQRTHRIESESPGSFFSEQSFHAVPERTIEAALAVLPASAFRFRFYDALAATVDVEGEPQTVRKNENTSAWHYAGGTIYTLAEMEALNIAEAGRYDILLSNMRGNGWDRVIHTPKGNWHPWEDDFVYVPVPGSGESVGA